ncbi:MAG: glycosyltransferase family 4 protein [Acidimicrobiia bacterium]
MTAPIEILQVITSNSRRGAEVFAYQLGDELVRTGHQVTTVALTGGAARPLDVPVLGRRALDPATLRALRRRAGAAEVVVGHGSRTLPACALGLAGGGTPFVYRNIGDPTAWSGSGLRKLRTTAFLRRAALVVALTPAAAATLEQGYGIPSDRLVVIPSAVPAAVNTPADPTRRAAARGALGIGADEPVVAMVGALSEEKAPALAVEAVAALDGVHLVVAGDGPLRAEVESLAGSRAPGRVHFLGSVPDPSAAYDAADAVLLCSRTEGLPGVLLEAGLRELPVVATNVGYVAEAVRNGETGVLVPSGDAIAITDALRQVLDAPGTMGLRARERCLAEFELTGVAARWADALAGVVSRRRAR